MSNTEQQLCAEIADLRAQLDAVGAGGVGKLMPPAAQPAEFEVWATVTEEGNFLESGALLRHVLGRRALISLGDVAAAWPNGVL